MKHLNNFRIFEADNWWSGKFSEFDLDENDIKDYLNYITDEYDVSVDIKKRFWNDDFKILQKKGDLNDHKYYPGYDIHISPNEELSNVDKYLEYNRLLLNALNSLNKNYSCRIINTNLYNFTIVCLDKTQELEIKFKNKKNNTNIIIDKLSRITKICKIIKNEDDPVEQNTHYYVKETEGTSPERLKEILIKLFNNHINDNEIEISELSLKLKKDPQGDYYIPSRTEIGFSRAPYKKLFLIKSI
jgi:hypothetical protein